MKYTGPKYKLVRREGINLFGSAKYDVKKRRVLPGQKANGSSFVRLSDYGKLLRNKQVLKRMYLLTEKQFAKIVTQTSKKYAKNNNVAHDAALIQFLERRMDAVVLAAGFANTIMQARQMVGHAHFELNGVKHNIPSTFLNIGDKITVRGKLQSSPLYSSLAAQKGITPPSWLNVDYKNMTIELIRLPEPSEINVPVDLLKVVEFYARA
ncbi:MAG: 30S ribosomal protein S4 [Candidatus Peribacteria bacterium]|nr:MAG: 30S ribosomal protein S4 [Candidatus Peribacteria bacterium]